MRDHHGLGELKISNLDKRLGGHLGDDAGGSQIVPMRDHHGLGLLEISNQDSHLGCRLAYYTGADAILGRLRRRLGTARLECWGRSVHMGDHLGLG